MLDEIRAGNVATVIIKEAYVKLMPNLFYPDIEKFRLKIWDMLEKMSG